LFHFGYRPELQKRVNEAVEKEIKKVKAEKEAKQENGAVKNGRQIRFDPERYHPSTGPDTWAAELDNRI